MRSLSVVAAFLALSILSAADGNASARRSLDGVLVQFEWVPTWGSLADLQTFGRIPELTLFDDGTVVYLDAPEPPDTGWKVRTASLGREERTRFVEEVLARGFERLESHTDRAGRDAEGRDIVVFDAAHSVITVRLPSGDYRTVRNYDEFANDRQALKSVRSFLTDWTTPDAEDYVPEGATLFIRRISPRSSDEGAAGGDSLVSDVSWTLPAALLRPPRRGICEWALPIGSAEYQALMPESDVAPRRTRYVVRHRGERFDIDIVVWLPNEDHSAAVHGYRVPCL